MVRLLAVLLLCLAFPAAAAGQVENCVAPPGTAAIDEYCEVVGNPGPPSKQAFPTVRRATESRLMATARGRRVLRSVYPYRTGRPPRADVAQGRSAGTGALGAVALALGRAATLGHGLLWMALAILLGMSAWFAVSRREQHDA